MARRFVWAVVIAPPVSGAVTNVLLGTLTYWTVISNCWGPVCDNRFVLFLLVTARSAMTGLVFGTVVGIPLMASLGRLLIDRLQATGYKRLRHYVITGIGCGLPVSLVFNFGIPHPSPMKSHLMAGSIVFITLALAAAWLIWRPDQG